MCVCARQVMDIFESFTERTPGSFLEIKDSCLSWHYRDADPDFGVSQVKIKTETNTERERERERIDRLGRLGREFPEHANA